MAQLVLFDQQIDFALDVREIRTAGEAMDYLRGLGPAYAGDAELREHLAGRMVANGDGEEIVSQLLN